MGVDAEIYCECDGEPNELVLPRGFTLEPADAYAREAGATHKVVSFAHYYGIHYTRGSWPNICAVLMSLFASSNVKRVWYFGDSSMIEEALPISQETVLRISRYYMTHGKRPWRDPEYLKSV